MRVGAQGPQRRPQAGDEARRESDGGGEGGERPVVVDVESDRSAADCEQARQGLDRQLRDQQAHGGSQQEQQQGLGHQLPEQAARAGPGREADRELLLASGAASEQQAPQVGAGDEQDDPGHE